MMAYFNSNINDGEAIFMDGKKIPCKITEFSVEQEPSQKVYTIGNSKPYEIRSPFCDGHVIIHVEEIDLRFVSKQISDFFGLASIGYINGYGTLSFGNGGATLNGLSGSYNALTSGIDFTINFSMIAKTLPNINGFRSIEESFNRMKKEF